MAGRKPREPKFPPLPGTGIPLRGIRDPDSGGTPASFGKRNTASQIHGASNAALVADRAALIMRKFLTDDGMPPHIRLPEFRGALTALCRVEAMTSFMWEFLTGLSAEEVMTPYRNATKSPVDMWGAMETRCASLRSKLGLDPASYARIARDLGIERDATRQALEGHAAQGDEIIARRRELEGGTPG